MAEMVVQVVGVGIEEGDESGFHAVALLFERAKCRAQGATFPMLREYPEERGGYVIPADRCNSFSGRYGTTCL